MSTRKRYSLWNCLIGSIPPHQRTMTVYPRTGCNISHTVFPPRRSPGYRLFNIILNLLQNLAAFQSPQTLLLQNHMLTAHGLSFCSTSSQTHADHKKRAWLDLAPLNSVTYLKKSLQLSLVRASVTRDYRKGIGQPE